MVNEQKLSSCNTSIFKIFALFHVKKSIGLLRICCGTGFLISL